MMRLRRRLMLLALASMTVPFAAPAFAADTGPVVLAAASMQESLNAAAEVWARAGHPRPVLSFAASSALARQIEAGAPADLFISADPDWMEMVAAKRLIAPGTRATLVGNRLVIVAALGQPSVPLHPAAALVRALGAGPLAMADPDAVPAGRYGKAALTKLGVWARLRDRVVAGDSVRAALALVERRVVPYGIVYATDAAASTKVRVAAVFPADSHPPIQYPISRLTASRHPDAEAFRRFLLSPEGQAILLRFGFVAPGR